MRLCKLALTLATAGAMGAGGLMAATPAAADYGQGAAYQIEISANISGKHGGGAWLWTELTPSSPAATSGTGEYRGSDCGRGAAEHARADGGDDSYSISGGVITISGVVLNGLGGIPVTITVPSEYGHYTSDFVSVLPTLEGAPLFLPPGVGVAQVQVAP